MPPKRTSQSRSPPRRSPRTRQSRSPRQSRSRSTSAPKLNTFKKERSADLNKKRKVLKTKGRGFDSVTATRDLSKNLLHDAWNLHNYDNASLKRVEKCNPAGSATGSGKCQRIRNPVTGFCELEKKCLNQDIYSPILNKCVPPYYKHSEEQVTSFVNNVLIPTQSKLKRGLPIDLLQDKKRYGFMDYKNVDKKRK